jgi:hypothetical protein
MAEQYYVCPAPPQDMGKWEETSPRIWETRKELLGTRLLFCCRRPKGYVPSDGDMPYGHVYVMKDERVSSDHIEHYRIQDGGPLEIECIAHEMRVKYGAHS